MKKKSVIALLLAIVMCFGLCACGGEASKESSTDWIPGTWEGLLYEGYPVTLEFGEDSTLEVIAEGESQYEGLQWEYLEEDDVIEVSKEGTENTIYGEVYENDEGVKTISLDFGGGAVSYTKQGTE